MADGDEDTVYRHESVTLAGVHILDFRAPYAERVLVADNLFQVWFQTTSTLGFFNRRSCRIFSARKLSRRWIDGDLGGEIRQEQRFFNGGVAAADRPRLRLPR
jgi:hypothetical protein